MKVHVSVPQVTIGKENGFHAEVLPNAEQRQFMQKVCVFFDGELCIEGTNVFLLLPDTTNKDQLNKVCDAVGLEFQIEAQRPTPAQWHQEFYSTSAET